MKNNRYLTFARFYAALTSNISYSERAKYLKSIINDLFPAAEILLDLACGTGSLSIELDKLGFDVIAVDASEAMLSELYDKKIENSADNILVLCQKMQELDLYGTVDVTVCALDSVNHITDKNILQTAFDKVSLFTVPGGLFIFDANTVYKHRNILADNTFVYDLDDVYCVWQNSLNPDDNTVSMDIDFFYPDESSGSSAYFRASDTISEKAYSVDELSDMLKKSGFEIVNIFGDYNFSAPAENEERVVFVARKV